MKVCSISDTHMMHLELEMPPADILIHCGDGTDIGATDEIIRLNAWFGKLKNMYSKILYVPGNHDTTFEEDPDYCRELMTNATVLIDEVINIDGKKIYGSPWVPVFFDWAFMRPDLNLSRYWDNIPENLDILITHGPPYGILDQTHRGDLAGSQTLMKAVLDKKPRFHVFGHIHEGYGQYFIESTTFINAASCPVWTSTGLMEKQPIIFEV